MKTWKMQTMRFGKNLRCAMKMLKGWHYNLMEIVKLQSRVKTLEKTLEYYHE